MSKKKKNKNLVGNFLPGFQKSVEMLKNECASALSEGRIRRAFLYMKELLSHMDFSADCLPLAGRITEQKMLQMHLEGDDSQIAGLFQAVLSKTPALRGHIQTEFMVLPHWHEGNGAYWQKYESEPAIKEQIEAFVLKLLRDPADIASHKLIAETHPLKITAKLITSAWTELEQGNETPLDTLNQNIGRHSPFVAWRLFLNALQAYYTGMEAPALENLARIRPDSPLAKVAAELATLIKNRGKAESKIQETILGETRENSLQKKVLQLEENLGKNLSSYQCTELARAVFTDELHKNRPILYWNLGVMFQSMLFSLKTSMAPWKNILREMKDCSRILLLNHHLDMEEDLEEWINFAISDGPSDLERALINDWIATLYSLKLHPDKTEHFLFSKPRISQENANKLFERMQYYWEHSTKFYPLQEAYSKWHRMSEFFLSPAQSDEILEDWLADFPDDVSVYCKLLDSARKRKVYTKAATQLKRLEEVAPNHPSLASVRELLQIENVLDLIAKRRMKEAGSLCAEFTPPSCLFVNAFQNFVRVLLKQPGINIEYPLIAMHLHGTMQRNKSNFLNQINLSQSQETDADKFFQEFEALLAQRDVIWGDVCLSDLKFPEKRLSALDQISSKRIWSLCQFFLDQASHYHYGINLLSFLWTLSAEGMSRQDNQTGAFLFLRAHVLIVVCCRMPFSPSKKTFRKRALTVLAAAAKHLRKVGNLDPLKNLDPRLALLNISPFDFNALSENMEQNKLQKIIRNEIAAEIKPLLKQSHLYGPSSRISEEKEYPRLLEGYRFFEEDFEEDEEDFNEDVYENYLKDVIKQLAEAAGRSGNDPSNASK